MGGKAILVVVVGFVIVASYTMSTIGTSSTRALSSASESASKQNSKRLALSGAKMALARVNQDTAWRGNLGRSPRLADGGTFTASLSRIPSSDMSILRSISNYPSSVGTLHDTVDLLLRKNTRNSFSILAWMSNDENNVTWISGDTVWGKLHTNGKLKVNGSPCFTGFVSSTDGFSSNPGSGSNRGRYLAGYNGSADSIVLPSSLTELSTAASTGGKSYGSALWITLSAGTSADGDGTAAIRYSSTGSVIETINLSSSSFNGVIKSSSTIHVKGTLDGRLTICSLQDVYIDDNIYYERDPRTVSSTDVLGLVADDDVIVADNYANNSHCTIHASIFARGGSFKAENHDTRPVCGELRVLGSIVQDVRGAVGKFSSWSGALTSGYSKRYAYDQRLADDLFRPPFYPGFVTSRLTIVDIRYGGVQANVTTKKNKIKEDD